MCCWGLIARQDIPLPSATASLFGGVWNTVLLKSAGRCRLVIQLIQWRGATSVTVIFFNFPSCCLQRVKGEKSLFLFLMQKQSTAQLWRKFCFCHRLYKGWKKQLTDIWTVEFLSTVIWANYFCFLHYNSRHSFSISYYMLHKCSLYIEARALSLLVLIFWYYLNLSLLFKFKKSGIRYRNSDFGYWRWVATPVSRHVKCRSYMPEVQPQL